VGGVGGLAALATASVWPSLSGVAGRVAHGYAENDGVRTHYVTMGQGPPVLLIHGIPEFWYSWRFQIEPLAAQFQVVAIDQRGFNQSDRPAERAGYRVQHLVADVAAVIRQLGRQQATIIGHDAGAWVAWHFAAAHPELTTRLGILSVPHPNALAEELAHNPAQHAAGQYARDMQAPDAAPAFRVGPVGLQRDPGGWPLYLSAEQRSDPNAITSFYQLSYPREPYLPDPALDQTITAPTLVIHGRNDPYLLASGHLRNARWMRTPPETVLLDAGHFVHQELPDHVNQHLLSWLNRGEDGSQATARWRA
jgi:pimeloyl-ACP methyl ester carboxylesterase